MMRSLVFATLCLFLHLLAPLSPAAADDRLDRLVLQAKGEKFFYDRDGGDLGGFASWTTRNFEAWGRVHAVRLLAKEGAADARAIDALIDILRTGPNDFDTGDGIIPLRSEVALALGKIGDPKAIAPLLERLKVPPEPAALTAGASVAPAARLPHLPSFAACAEALLSLGDAAMGTLPDLERAERALPDGEAKGILRKVIGQLSAGHPPAGD